MEHAEDIRTKRRRLFEGNNTFQQNRDSDVIDLTGSDDCDSDDDEPIDLTGDYQTAEMSSYSADEALARRLQAKWSREDDFRSQKVSSNHAPNKKSASKTAPNKLAQPGPTSQPMGQTLLDLAALERTVRNLAERFGMLRCAACQSRHTLRESQADAIGAKLEKSQTSALLTCRKCGADNTRLLSRTILIWCLLCRFDAYSSHNQKEPTSNRTERLPNSSGYAVQLYGAHGNANNKGNGTGYGGGTDWNAAAFNPALNPMAGYNIQNGSLSPMAGYNTQSGRTLEDSTKNQELAAATLAEDKWMADLLSALTQLLQGARDTKELASMLLCSSVLERVADLLRNTDLGDVEARATLYHSLCRFVGILAGNPAMSSLVFGERIAHQPGMRLFDISLGNTSLQSRKAVETAQSLAQSFEGLGNQVHVMLKSDGLSKKAVQLFQALQALDKTISSGRKVGAAQPTRSKNAWHKDLAVLDLSDEDIMSGHSQANDPSQPSVTQPPWMKRIVREIATLRASLPDGIFVRHAESRPNFMKVLMVGPKDTPYENGLFEFDMFCGPDFPQAPPKMMFRTTGGGRVSFNPNLYPNGKVCLSLLGTWPGEKWDSNQSTLLQVLVSIHAMIFCEAPWQNEPGQERFDKNSEPCRNYNRGLYRRTVQHAMIDWLEKKTYPAPTGGRNSFMPTIAGGMSTAFQPFSPASYMPPAGQGPNPLFGHVASSSAMHNHHFRSQSFAGQGQALGGQSFGKPVQPSGYGSPAPQPSAQPSSEAAEGIWDEIVRRHFEENAGEIIATVNKWVSDVPPTPRRGGLASHGGAFAGHPLFPQAGPQHNMFAPSLAGGQHTARTYGGTGLAGKAIGGRSAGPMANETLPNTASTGKKGGSLLQQLKEAMPALRQIEAAAGRPGAMFGLA